MRRRTALIALASLLVLANAAFFVLRDADQGEEVAVEIPEEDYEEVDAYWVAFMPDFEASQRSDPQSFGVHNPPPHDGGYDVVEGRRVSAMSMVAGQCRLEQYAVRTANDHDEYMPERLFAGQLSDEQRSCLVELLPEGYRLAQLVDPTRPSRVAWTTDLADITVGEEQDAQTP